MHVNISKKVKKMLTLDIFNQKEGKKRGQKIKSKDAIINISSRQNTRRKKELYTLWEFMWKMVLTNVLFFRGCFCENG